MIEVNIIFINVLITVKQIRNEILMFTNCINNSLFSKIVAYNVRVHAVKR